MRKWKFNAKFLEETEFDKSVSSKTNVQQQKYEKSTFLLVDLSMFISRHKVSSSFGQYNNHVSLLKATMHLTGMTEQAKHLHQLHCIGYFYFKQLILDK